MEMPKDLSFAEMIEYVMNDIHYWSRYVQRCCGYESEDAEQEILIMLWKEHGKRRALNRTFLRNRIIWKAKRIIKENQDNFKRVYLEDYEEMLDDKHEAFINNILRTDALDRIVEKIEKEDLRAAKVIQMLFEGFKNKEIAKEMRLTEKHLSTIIGRKIKPILRGEIHAIQ